MEPQLLRSPADDVLVGGSRRSLPGKRSAPVGEAAVHPGFRRNDLADVPSGSILVWRGRRALDRGRSQSLALLLVGRRRLGSSRRTPAAVLGGRRPLPPAGDAFRAREPNSTRL